MITRQTYEPLSVSFGAWICVSFSAFRHQLKCKFSQFWSRSECVIVCWSNCSNLGCCCFCIYRSGFVLLILFLCRYRHLHLVCCCLMSVRRFFFTVFFGEWNIRTSTAQIDRRQKSTTTTGDVFFFVCLFHSLVRFRSYQFCPLEWKLFSLFLSCQPKMFLSRTMNSTKAEPQERNRTRKL